MERIDSATNTIATEKLPFHTLARARHVYTRRMKRSLMVLAGSLSVVAVVFTIAALPLVTVIKIGCTFALVVALYIVCAKSQLRRIVAVRANEILSHFLNRVASNGRTHRLISSELGALIGTCVFLVLFVVVNPLRPISKIEDSAPLPPMPIPEATLSLPQIYGETESSPQDSGDDYSVQKMDEKLSIQVLSGTWLSEDGRYLVDIMSRDNKALFIRFRDKETGLAQLTEIGDGTELELEDVVVRFGLMDDDGLHTGSEALEQHVSYLVSAETAPDGQPSIEVYEFTSSTSTELQRRAYEAVEDEP